MTAQIAYAKVDPGGNVFRLDFTDGATGGGPTDIVSIGNGCTLTVNGTPLALTNGFGPAPTAKGTDAGSWIQWPLGAAIYQVGVGKRDAGYSETGGGWQAVASSEGFAETLAGSNGPWGYRSTTDGAATARHHFGADVFVASGLFRLSANLKWICGVAGRTVDAVYTVLDSDGTTVLATFHVDQTRQDLPFHRIDRKLHLTDLGTFTTTGAGFTVVVSNNAGVPWVLGVDDTFTRADSGTVGNGWVPLHAGIWSISGNKLVATADGTAGPTDGQFDLLRPSGEDALNHQVEATSGPVVGAENYFPVLRYNRTTHDKYFAFMSASGLGLATSIAGTSAALGGGGISFGPVPAGHRIKVVVSASGSSPTTLSATAYDVTAGTTLGTLTRTDSSATLQAAGGSGVTYGSGTAGVTLAYSEVVTRNIGAGGGSTLVADFLYAETVQPRTVPLGATCTFDAPAGVLVTRAGALPAVTALAAHLTTDMNVNPALSWFKYVDLTVPHPMVLGYNKVFPDQLALPNRAFFNLVRGGTGWVGKPPPSDPSPAVVPVDQPTGELTGAVTGGHAEAYWYSNITNAIDSWGYINNPRSTRWRLEFDFTLHGEAGGIPNCGFLASTNDAAITPVAGPTLVSGNRWFIEADIALHVVPDPSNWPGTGFAANYGGQIGIQTVSQINNVSITDVGNHRGWTRKCHPEFYRLMAGKGFGDIRYLDAIVTNDCHAVNAGEMPPATGRFCNAFAKYITFTTVLSIAPVDLSPADTDDALKWFQLENNECVVKVTTATPHGLTTGHRPLMDFSQWGGAQSWPMNIGGTGRLDFNTSSGYAIVVVLSPTTLLMMAHSDDVHKIPDTDGQPPVTLAAPQDMTASGTTRLVMQADTGECIEDVIAIAVECGCVPWLNVPVSLTASGLDEFATRVEAATPLGQVIRIEHYNEPWNNKAPAAFLEIYRNHFNYLNTHGLAGTDGSQFCSNSLEVQAYLSNRTFKAIRAKWAAAGRPVTEVVRIMNVISAFPEGTTENYLTWFWNAHQAGLTDGFDELCGDCYQDALVPNYSRAYVSQDDSPGVAGNTFAGWQRLDVSGVVSAMGPITTDTGRSTQVRRQYDCLAGTLRNTNSPFDLRVVPWAGSGLFAAVKYINYEGGFADLMLRQTLNDQRNGPDAGGRNFRESMEVARHPRAYFLELARLVDLEAAGVTRSVRFSLNFPQANQDNWYDFHSYNMDVGTGNPAENPNPFDAPNVVSQLGGAFRAFAAAGGTPPPPAAVAAGAFLISSQVVGC